MPYTNFGDDGSQPNFKDSKLEKKWNKFGQELKPNQSYINGYRL